MKHYSSSVFSESAFPSQEIIKLLLAITPRLTVVEAYFTLHTFAVEYGIRVDALNLHFDRERSLETEAIGSIVPLNEISRILLLGGHLCIQLAFNEKIVIVIDRTSKQPQTVELATRLDKIKSWILRLVR